MIFLVGLSFNILQMVYVDLCRELQPPYSGVWCLCLVSGVWCLVYAGFFTKEKAITTPNVKKTPMERFNAPPVFNMNSELILNLSTSR